MLFIGSAMLRSFLVFALFEVHNALVWGRGGGTDAVDCFEDLLDVCLCLDDIAFDRIDDAKGINQRIYFVIELSFILPQGFHLLFDAFIFLRDDSIGLRQSLHPLIVNSIITNILLVALAMYSLITSSKDLA